MYRQFLLLTFAVILLLVPLPVTASVLADETEELMSNVMDTYNIPGASLAIVREGEMEYVNSWGEMSDGSEVTPRSSFLIGSISKPITSLGVMLLVDQGELTLDEPVNTYLTYFDYVSPNEQLISIRDLLEHTSGITSHDSFAVTDQKTFTGDTAISKAVDQLSGVKLAAEPGDTYEYASANYLLLGAVIEEVTGKTFAEFTAEEIFAPLGMTDASANYDAALSVGYVPGYQSWMGNPIRSKGFYDHSGAPYGYMTASADDLGKFLGFLLNGEELLSDNTHKLYTSVFEEGQRYGFGWRFTNPFDDRNYAWHTGASPDYRSEIFFDTSGNSGAVLLINKYHQLEAEAYLSMMEGIRHIMNGEEPPLIGSPSTSTQWTLTAAFLIIVLTGIATLSFLYLKKIRNNSWTAVGVLSLIFGGSLMPLFSLLFGTPWQTIRVFTPDVAFLIQVITAVFLIWGTLILVLLTVNRRQAETL